MYKIAVVGDKDSVLAFRALGVDVFIAYEKEETRRIIDTAANTGYGLIYITEQLAQLIPETIERYETQATPAIILIPSHQGSLGIGMQNIIDNVSKAVGSNIL